MNCMEILLRPSFTHFFSLQGSIVNRSGVVPFLIAASGFRGACKKLVELGSIGAMNVDDFVSGGGLPHSIGPSALIVAMMVIPGQLLLVVRGIAIGVA